MFFAISLAATAHAQSHLEVQLDDVVLTDLFAGLAQQYAPCGEEATCPGGEAGPCLVDHYEVSGPASLTTGAGQVLVTVPMTKHVMTCVGDPGCTPTPVSSPSLQANLQVDYLDIDSGPGETLWPFLCASVLGMEVDECQPLPAAPFELVPFGLWDLSSDGDRLALRLGNVGDPWWGAFNNGVLAVPMTEPGTIFVGWEAFRAQADAQLGAALDDLPSGLSIDGPAAYTWTPNGGQGILDMTVPFDFSPVATGDFYATTTITFEPQPLPCSSGDGTCTRLRLDIAADLDVYPSYLPVSPIDMLLIEAAAMGMAGIFDAPQANCIAVDSWNMTCWEEVQNLSLSFPGPSGDAVTLDVQPTWMWTDVTGISLGGPAHVDAPEQWVDVGVETPEYGVHGSCTGAYAGWSTGRVHALGHHDRCEVDFDHSGYWYEPVLETGTELGWGPASWIATPDAQISYPAGDHALYATVVTTAGIRTAAIDAPKAPTVSEMQDAENHALGKRLNCAQMYIPYAEIPWLEEMIAPIDPWETLRDQLVQVYDMERVARGVAAVTNMAFEHHDDGTAWVTGQLVATGAEETQLFDVRFYAGEAGREGPEALEEQLLEEGIVGEILLPEELGEESGLFVEVHLQTGADHESSWIEQFSQLDEGVEAPEVETSTRGG